MPVRGSKTASISCAVLATQRAGYCRTDLLSFPFVFMNIPGSFVYFCDAVVTAVREPPLQAT